MRQMAVRAIIACVFQIAHLAGADVLQFVANLDGSQNVPPHASAGTGLAVVTVDTATNSLTWMIAFRDLSGPALAAHFHEAAVGFNGVVKFNIADLTSPSDGSATFTEADEVDILNGLWYVDYATSAFPGGEIRGQLYRAVMVSYQGRLTQSGAPATGTADFQFKIHDALAGGTQISPTITLTGIPVSDGLFTVELPIPSGVFGIHNRWLQVEAAFPAGGSFETLTPRQPINAAPQAAFSFATAAHTHDATEIASGVIASAQLPTNLAKTDSANTWTGTNTYSATIPAFNGGTSGTTAPFTVDSTFKVTNLNADLLDGMDNTAFAAAAHAHAAADITSGTLADARLSTNIPRLDGANAFTTGTNSFVNVSASGFLGNATGPAELRGNNAVALRLYGNVSSPNIIGGYSGNGFTSGVTGAVICGGGEFQVNDYSNQVEDEGCFVGGGRGNFAGDASAPLGGEYAVVVGGNINSARGSMSVVGGGQMNDAPGFASTVPGGNFNVAGGNYSVAMGQRSKVRTPTNVGGGDTDGDEGAFVWADSTNADFQSTGPDQFLIRAAGGVGIGTNSPQAQFHVQAAELSVASAALSADTAIIEGDDAVLGIISPGTSGAFGSAIALREVKADGTLEDTWGIIVRNHSATNPSLRFTYGTAAGPGANTAVMTLSETGNLGVGTFPTARLHAVDSNTLMVLNRTTTDGALVSFQQDGTTEGSISVTGTTVTYGAFTGVHAARIDAPLARGTLVRFTGENDRVCDAEDAEPIYGVTATTSANDPACVGAYLGLMEPGHPFGRENPHQVMSVGNGDMWVVDTGRDIKAGDLLIASDVAGCAMLDDPERFPVGNIVARAAENVRWAETAPDHTGVRRAKISVLFDRFTRGGGANGVDALRAEIESLRAENQALRSESADVLHRIEQIEAAVGGGKMRSGAQR